MSSARRSRSLWVFMVAGVALSILLLPGCQGMKETHSSRQPGQNQLITMIQSEDTAGIARLAATGVNFNQPGSNGKLPLREAVWYDKPGSIRALVQHGAIVDQRDHKGQTALYQAVGENRIAAMQTLLELGANPNQRDSKGDPLLYLACAKAWIAPEVVATLIKYGANYRLAGANGLTPAQALTGGRRLDLNQLHQLPSREAEKLVFLIEAGVRPSLPTNATGQPSLHQIVATLNQPGLITKLIQVYELDVNAQDEKGWTPLHVAMWRQQVGAGQALLAQGANPNLETTADAEERCFVTGSRGKAKSICRYLVPVGSRPLDVKPERYFSNGWSTLSALIRQAGGTSNPAVKSVEFTR